MKVQFGDVELDSDSRQLRRGGREVHLSTKAFDLLTLLVARRPAAVPKSEIHRHLWRDTFVSDTNLPTLVAEIRAAIGDDARRTRFVRTVHRFGYAFQGDTAEAPDRAGDQPEAAWLVGASTRIALHRGENVLGREGEAILAIDSPTISRRHARVIAADGAATIEDLGSKNGTYVNGARVTSPVPVTEGDEVRVGSLVFTLRFARTGSSTQTI